MKNRLVQLVVMLGMIYAAPCFAANWQSAGDTYERSQGTSGSIAGSAAFAITFDDQTGCVQRHYAFGLDLVDGSRVYTGYTGVDDADLPVRVTQLYVPTSTTAVTSVAFYCMSSPTTTGVSSSTGALESSASSTVFTIYPDSPYFVQEGGTGATSFTTNGVLLGNGTSAIQATAIGNPYEVLRVPSGGGAPAFGAIDLSQSAAVTGVLGLANGGTGQSTVFTTGSVIFAGTNGILNQNNSNFFWNNSSTRLGIGTSSPSSTLDVIGTSAARHFKGNGSTPTATTTNGGCAGSGGSIGITIKGSDAAGDLVLTTGSSSTKASADCFKVTYNTAYGTAPYIVFSPANANAAALSGAKSVYASSTVSSFTFAVGATALTSSTAYRWEYNVIE